MERKIRELIKNAMLQRNKNAQSTYKNIFDCAQKMAKDSKSDVTDELIIQAAKKEIKQLNDLKSYCESNPDACKEVDEKIAYCEEILPSMVSEDEILKYLVDNDIEKNMGVCMKTLKQHFCSSMDGRIAQSVVKSYIN